MPGKCSILKKLKIDNKIYFGPKNLSLNSGNFIIIEQSSEKQSKLISLVELEITIPFNWLLIHEKQRNIFYAVKELPSTMNGIN